MSSTFTTMHSSFHATSAFLSPSYTTAGPIDVDHLVALVCASAEYQT